MGKTQLIAGLVVAFLAISSSANELKRILGYRLGGARLPPPETENMFKVRAGVVGDGYFSQLTCHFTDLNTTWSQHYYYNYEFQPNYLKATNNAAFLMIGGEGPEGPSWSRNKDLPWMKWAAANGAAVFDLEHRFYGQSQPFEKQTVENLKYLSSRQAIEDLAYFIQYINKQNGWTGTKWVVFGGSYSGALAAWFRQLHPELVAGAVGSSGPVQATLDFYQYLQVVENSLSYNGTDNAKGWKFGSADCLASVKDAYSQVMDLMKTMDGRDWLSDNFQLDPRLNDLPLTYNDVQNFYTLIFGQFQGVVQYSNDRGRDDLNSIGTVCDLMTTAPDTMTGLLNVTQFLNSDKDGNFLGLDNNYTGDVQMLKWEGYEDLDLAAARSWIWQTCTEFGFYQSTDYTQGIFGATTPLSVSINMCTDIYGPQFTADRVNQAVKATNAYYGGAAGYWGTNVVLPNGDLDPWHALGRYQSDYYSQVTYLIEGSAHCGDMYAPKAGDMRYEKIHGIIGRQIYNWVNGPPQVSEAMRPEVAERKSKEAARMEKKFPSQPKQFTPTITQLGKKLPDDDGEKHYPISQKVPMLRHRPRMLTPEFDLDLADTSGYSAFTFTQPLCHFNNDIPDTFQQRWWKNTKWARPGGPNFLMIGGEGPANPAKWVLNEDITYLKWAAQYGATVYYMEHRCYGESHDLGNSTYKTDYVMLFCNSWQSLWDVKLFIETVNYREGNTAPWITFGGSYSGMLSLWARNKFPSLIAGAVGSSAPINIKLDFYEYLAVVENSLRMYDNDCADKVKDGFAQMQQLALTPQGIKNLSDIFVLDPAWNEDSTVTETDLQFFFSNIYGAFQGAVQYSGDNTQWYANNEGDIGGICASMSNYSDGLQAVLAANQYMWKYYVDPSLNLTFSTYNNYTDMILSLRDLSAGADRTWTYQTCVEFGFFQSTDTGYNIFGSPTPVNMYLQMCYDIFGQLNDGNVIEGSDYSTRQIQSDINDHYNFYSADFDASNIAALNGNVDPWHALGHLKATALDQTILLINATAHCADMYPERETDPQGLKDARKTIGDMLGQWIQQATSPRPTVSPQCPVLFVVDGSSYWPSFRSQVVSIATTANLAYSAASTEFLAHLWEYGNGNGDEAIPTTFYGSKDDFLDRLEGMKSSYGNEYIDGATSKLNKWSVDGAVIVIYSASPQSLISSAGKDYREKTRTVAVHLNDGVDMSPLSDYPSPQISNYQELADLILQVCHERFSL